ncbi:hypothetical protein [Acidisphaera sp. S103]|uniref:hypothetical protein n=1 Tax=Acidisphaera sp. S103 TaxID=1747223 RepID=UPI00131B9240|nr:hypothetical protein [Acidisphaera sp. S103]
MSAHLSSGVSVETVSRTMEALLIREGRPVVYHDIATGADLPVSAKNTASPTGLLPALIVAGEAVWREATGTGFGLDIVRDRDALLGFRLRGIGAGSFTTVMLATMEATAQVTGSGVVVASDLNALWSAVTKRVEQNARAQARSAPGVSP